MIYYSVLLDVYHFEDEVRRETEYALVTADELDAVISIHHYDCDGEIHIEPMSETHIARVIADSKLRFTQGPDEY
jgi:hypothetical protein